MNRHLRPAAVPFALVAAVFVSAACGNSKKPKPPAPDVPTQPAAPGVPALTAAQNAQIKAAFAEANSLAKAAHEHLLAAQKIEGESSIQDAYEDYREAKHGYRDAMQIVEVWLQEDFGNLTRPQIDAFMKPYENDVVHWQKSLRLIPKVPPKD